MTTVAFVCWGNICRSPMAERVARRHFDDAGLTEVETVSFGVSSEELGNPIDSRAGRTLRAHGYDADAHRARQISRSDIAQADLVVAMEDIHVDRMARIAHGDDMAHVMLLSAFDPDAPQGQEVPDPWYGGQDGFEDTLAMIEGAMPGLVQKARELSEPSS